MLNIENIRTIGHQAVKETVTDDLWKRNEDFSLVLVDIIEKHRFSHHPIYTTKKLEHLSQDWINWCCLECGTILANMTHAIIRALGGCIQLQPRLELKAVFNARFLLQIIVLDELGYIIPTGKGEYQTVAHPDLAPTLDFLKAGGQNIQNLENHQVSNELRDFKRCLEDNYDDYLRLLCVVVTVDAMYLNNFSGWMKKVAKLSGIDTSQGYYSISADEGYHSDLCCLFKQAVTPERYDEIRALTVYSLDTWASWLDRLLAQMDS